VPIKEQTVISYILDAARDGCEMNWNRFCEETGLTPEISSQIRLAIAKVGSRDKLRPVKDELPENVILLPSIIIPFLFTVKYIIIASANVGPTSAIHCQAPYMFI
jgi:hypothetical protein